MPMSIFVRNGLLSSSKFVCDHGELGSLHQGACSVIGVPVLLHDHVWKADHLSDDALNA